jgi:tol-pal system protein YbgF
MKIEAYRHRFVWMLNRRNVFVGIGLAAGLFLLLNAGRDLQHSHSLTMNEAGSIVVDRPTDGLADMVKRHPTGSDDPAKRLYDHVMREFHHQDYEAAEAGFRFFLALYPDAPLAKHAQYWEGECSFRLGRYQEAITSFDEVLSSFPLNPTFAAAALMHKGLSYAELGETVRSRHLLELVVAQYPESHEATIARRTLTPPLP